MLVRTSLFACAAAMAFASGPAMADTADDTQCDAATFRVYFQHGSAALDDTALQMLDAAERQLASCSYAELRVTVDGSSSLATARGEAIRAAADGRAWDSVNVRTTMHHDVISGPEYAEVTMSPRVLPTDDAPIGAANIGA